MHDIILNLAQILDSTLRVSTTLILAALAGLFSERVGIANIALEGKMLGAAFAAATAAYLLNSAFAGLAAGIMAAISLSLLHGYACINQRGDQIISGLAINLLMLGLTVVIAEFLFSQGGRTPTLNDDQRFLAIVLPGADALRDVPYLGAIYSELISGHNFFVYLAILLVPGVAWLLNHTPFGLNIRTAGDNPQALEMAGVSVFATRYYALIICGILTGLAGSYLAQAYNAFFLRNMTAGQGFIALAALIFGKWRPGTTLIGCLLFGVLDAISVRMQGVIVFGIGEMPVQLIQIMPYVLTVVLLAGFLGRAEAPYAIGKPYSKTNES